MTWHVAQILPSGPRPSAPRPLQGLWVPMDASQLCPSLDTAPAHGRHLAQDPPLPSSLGPVSPWGSPSPCAYSSSPPLRLFLRPLPSEPAKDRSPPRILFSGDPNFWQLSPFQWLDRT